MHMNYSQIMSPRPPLPRKVGGGGVMTPPAPMGAPPLRSRPLYVHSYVFTRIFSQRRHIVTFKTAKY